VHNDRLLCDTGQSYNPDIQVTELIAVEIKKKTRKGLATRHIDKMKTHKILKIKVRNPH